MRNLLGLAVFLLLLGTMRPADAVAQWRCDKCCKTCRLPPAQCGCHAVPIVPQVSYQAVVETQNVTRPVITQRDVVDTRYRMEAYNEVVPATAYENVTLDEGGYQTVYVPKIVTKQVAKTVYQNRTSYRSVPYQVTRRVSECTTQTVPVQSVRYVPTTTTAAIYGTTTIGYSAPAFSTSAIVLPTPAPISTGWLPTPAPSAPTSQSASAYVPTPLEPRPAPVSTRTPSLAPVPDPRFGQQGATPIYRRTAYTSNDAFGEYEPVAAEPLPIRQAERAASSLFVPAPSAATVWRAQGTSLR